MNEKKQYRMICDLEGLITLRLDGWAHRFHRSEVLLADLLIEWFQYKDVSGWHGCQEEAFDVDAEERFTEVIDLKDVGCIRQLIARTINVPSLDALSKELFNRI